MQDWQALLGINWAEISKNACDRSGECCRGAAQIRPWDNLLSQAARDEATARDFLNQFVPYSDLAAAGVSAPDALAASLEIVRERGEVDADLVLYRCRYLVGQSECRIYEDRPSLCREFPESPFGAIPACCGYSKIAAQCRAQMQTVRDELQRELAYYKSLLRNQEEPS